MSIVENLFHVQSQIREAAERAGRNPDEITLVAVSKSFPAELVVEAYRAGARTIGENRVEEASEKIPEVISRLGGAPPPAWHLVGHLQRRKARRALELFDVIESVDSVRLAETLNRHAAALGRTIEVLVQINIARDPNKFGFAPEPREQLFRDIEKMISLPSIKLVGLMTIGKLVPSAEEARPYFRALADLRRELNQRFAPDAIFTHLSMGMTDDFIVAIEEGATIVRIGRAIFGQRA